MKRLAHASALAIVAIVVLSGCVRYNVDMNLASNDTASGTVIIAVQSGSGEKMGLESDQEALTQLFGEEPFGSRFVPSEYTNGDWVGTEYTFKSVPISDLTDLNSLFTVTHNGDVYTVAGASPPITPEQKDQMPPDAESTLSITFPGDVIEHNGTLKGNTVTWDLLHQTDAIRARGMAGGFSSDSGGISLGQVARGFAFVALLGVATLIVFFLRNRSRRAPAGPAPLNPTASSPTAAPRDRDGKR